MSGGPDGSLGAVCLAEPVPLSVLKRVGDLAPRVLSEERYGPRAKGRGAPSSDYPSWKNLQRLVLTGVRLALVMVSLVSPVRGEGVFEESGPSWGLMAVHQHFGDGEKWMPENMGPGLAIFDYDFDGRLDIFVAEGGPLSSQDGKSYSAGRLFRQLSEGTFEDQTEKARVPRVGQGSGMGVAFADLNGDHLPEIAVSRFGRSLLFQPTVEGEFGALEGSPHTPLLPGDSGWGTGLAFADLDGDGDLDLYESHYVDFSLANHQWCGDAKRGLRAYCHPDVYEALPDRLYLQQEGRFESRGQTMGVVPSPVAKGLGVAVHDFDEDGLVDVLVANDSTQNQLYFGTQDGPLAERGLLSGIGFDGAGKAEASMGIALGDLTGDGQFEVLLTHLDQETHTLYKGSSGFFEDITDRTSLAAATLPWVGFGVAFLDLDHDRDLDVIVGNGHIIDNIELFDPTRRQAQPLQVFLNDSGRFRQVSSGLGRDLVARGLAYGDLDRDGDLDVMVAQNNAELVALRNSGQPSGYLLLELRGGPLNSLGLGARVELLQRSGSQTRSVASGGSYLSQSAPAVHFGLATEPVASATVTWPEGRKVRYLGLPRDRHLVLFDR